MLCLNEVYVYVKHDSVWNMMNDGVSMFKSQFYEFGDYVKGVLTCTHTHYEWKNEVMNVNGGL